MLYLTTLTVIFPDSCYPPKNFNTTLTFHEIELSAKLGKRSVLALVSRCEVFHQLPKTPAITVEIYDAFTAANCPRNFSMVWVRCDSGGDHCGRHLYIVIKVANLSEAVPAGLIFLSVQHVFAPELHESHDDVVVVVVSVRERSIFQENTQLRLTGWKVR